MATSQMSKLVDHLRRAVLCGDRTDLTDGQLLESFISRRDQAAFAALVKRHGSMVWGVCCRVLGNHHDAEDAFQATFLILVRKAASILPREMVPNWLYGVARQTALKARQTTAKRRLRERQVTQMPEPETLKRDHRDDLQSLLDQELTGLPDKYRVAIILCDLEGKTGKEAARHLKIPEGTLSSRLTTARRMLAKRLGRHGLPMSSGALAAVLSQNVASASVPTSVVLSTIKAAMIFAAGQAAATGAISARVAALTEGVLKTMLLTKLKTAMAVLLVVAVGGIGSGGLFYRTQAAEPASPQRQEQTAEDSQPSLASLARQLQKLQKTVDGLREEVKGLRANLGRGPDRPIVPATPSVPGHPGGLGAVRPPLVETPRPKVEERKPQVPEKKFDNELQKTLDALIIEVEILKAQRLDEGSRRPWAPPPEKKDKEKKKLDP